MSVNGIGARRGSRAGCARRPRGHRSATGPRGPSRAGGSPQDGAHPREQLGAAEGFDDVVVGAELEADDLVELGAPRSQHDQRNARVAPDLPADIPAVPVGQREVEDHEVELLPRAACRAPATVLTTVGTKPSRAAPGPGARPPRPHPRPAGRASPGRDRPRRCLLLEPRPPRRVGFADFARCCSGLGDLFTKCRPRWRRHRRTTQGAEQMLKRSFAITMAVGALAVGGGAASALADSGSGSTTTGTTTTTAPGTTGATGRPVHRDDPGHRHDRRAGRRRRRRAGRRQRRGGSRRRRPERGSRPDRRRRLRRSAGRERRQRGVGRRRPSWWPRRQQRQRARRQQPAAATTTTARAAAFRTTAARARRAATSRRDDSHPVSAAQVAS